MSAISPRAGLLSCALALCVVLSGCDRDAELLSNIPESQANSVVAALDNAHVASHKQVAKDGLVNVIVDASQVAAAVSALQAVGLPQDAHAQMGDVFRKEGLISSPLEERARYLWALTQELSETVAQIDGVMKARVHLVLPERASGSTPAVPSSAAVFIKHQPGYDLQAVLPQIKRLVSNSIPGLTEDRVAVVLVAAQRREAPAAEAAAASGARSAAPAANAQAAAGNRTTRIVALAAVLVGVLVMGGVAFVLRRHFSSARSKPTDSAASARADSESTAP